MDVERVVARHIARATGVRAYLDVPADRPEEFVTVALAGGRGDMFRRELTLTVQSWAKTRMRAAEISRLVELSVPGLMAEPDVFVAVPASTYRWPDPDSGQQRYQTTVEMTVCE